MALLAETASHFETSLWVLAMVGEGLATMAVTIDRGDFRVYRRNKRETIPLICPPVR